MSMFMQTVSQLNKRGTMGELDDALSRMVQQVRITGKAAELTYKIKIKPQDGSGETVIVADSITVKTADPVRKTSIFFTSEEGRISRNDPNQQELAMETIEGGANEAPAGSQHKVAAAG